MRNIYKYLVLKRRMKRYHSLGEKTKIDFTVKTAHPENISIGKNGYIGMNSQLNTYPHYLGIAPENPPVIKIGCDFFARQNLTILCAAPGRVIIGDNVACGGYVFITNENHGLDVSTENYKHNPLVVKDVIIEDGVWLGEKTMVLPGVHIGKKAVVGTGSVVTKDIPEYSIAVGNPARVIKKYNFDTGKWEKV